MRTDDFTFELPPELVAQQPATPRDASRLMVLRRNAGSLSHHIFRDLPQLLSPGDLLVVNDTRVMAARLHGHRDETGGVVEALLVRPLTDCRWEALFRPGRQAVPGRRFRFATASGELGAIVVGREQGVVVLDFDCPFDPGTVGSVPLPPYITKYEGDPERYQTVYSREPRSAAAPTAGLHFTEHLLDEVRTIGIERAAVTLEVGPGTFKPVTVEDPRDHQLHPEHIAIPEAAAARIREAKAEGRRVIAVGTTVVRTLEHVVRECGTIQQFDGWTGLRILPGDRFRAVDGIITNFHLPRSTLLMLVCAFAGADFVLDAYRTAVRERYRFYSFGDAMLILP